MILQFAICKTLCIMFITIYPLTISLQVSFLGFSSIGFFSFKHFVAVNMTVFFCHWLHVVCSFLRIIYYWNSMIDCLILFIWCNVCVSEAEGVVARMISVQILNHQSNDRRIPSRKGLWNHQFWKLLLLFLISDVQTQLLCLPNAFTVCYLMWCLYTVSCLPFNLRGTDISKCSDLIGTLN